ncbi:MAG TPA: IS21 family transposase [Acidobacteriaceae bacterium]|nr:IS21 family transposase [Acidobacteriaceae bacterium]
MKEWGTRVLLIHYLEQGLSKSAIAERLGIDRRTIHRWIRTGQLTRDVDTGLLSRPVRRRSQPAKLTPYVGILESRLAEYPELSAVRLLTEVRAAGYTGSYTQLKEQVRRLRPQPAVDPVVRFETEPGVQAQVDFAEVRFPWGKRYALLVVLGYSRLLWLRFYERQDMRTLFSGLEEAFAFFGGVPRELLFDQMASVITADLRDQGERLVGNAEFLRFAAHWGFRVRACRPYRARTKGKVERPIRYLRGSFLYGRDFLGDADLQAQAGTWLEGTANVRLHRTTGEPPVERFRSREQHRLQPLAERPYRSLILLPTVPSPPAVRTPLQVEVQRRPLATYARIAAGAR